MNPPVAFIVGVFCITGIISIVRGLIDSEAITSITGIFFIVMALVVVLGYNIGTREIKQEAIQHNCAHYALKVDSEGNAQTVFIWGKGSADNNKK